MHFYYEGYDAKGRGESIFRCPYKQGTAGHTYWYRGWIEALEQVSRNTTMLV